MTASTGAGKGYGNPATCTAPSGAVFIPTRYESRPQPQIRCLADLRDSRCRIQGVADVLLHHYANGRDDP